MTIRHNQCRSWPGVPIRSSDDLCGEVTVPVSVTVAVAVAGTGPAGLVIGHMLQRAGISFVLLERPP